jgi:hypothetical protein
LDKTDATLNISYIPAGVHRIVVWWKGRELSSDILIVNGQRTVVVVSFMKRGSTVRRFIRAEVKRRSLYFLIDGVAACPDYS